MELIELVAETASPEHFRAFGEWLEGDDENSAAALQVLLAGISKWRLPGWLSRAPAHPESLRAYLIEGIGNAYGEIVARHPADSGPIPMLFDVVAVSDVLPHLLTLTAPSDWAVIFNRDFDYRFTVNGSAKVLAALDGAWQSRWLRNLLRQAQGGYVRAPSWGGSRADEAVELAWTWPLTIVIDDPGLGPTFWGRLLPARSLVRVVRADEYDGTFAAVRLIAGDSTVLRTRARYFRHGQYAYVVGTGTTNKIEDLQKATNVCRSAGAAMLNSTSPTSLRTLMRFVRGFERAIGPGAPLDVMLRNSSKAFAPMLYAHERALTWTDPALATRALVNQLMKTWSAAELVLPDSVPLLKLVTGAYTMEHLALALARGSAAGMDPVTFREELSELGELTAALRQQVPDLRLDRRGGYSASPAREAPRKTIPRLAEDSVPAPVLRDYPRARNPSVSARLLRQDRELAGLEDDGEYALAVWIGNLRGANDVGADAALPVDAIDTQQSVVILRLIMLPLLGCADGEYGRAQSQEVLFDKASGWSGEARFHFRYEQPALEFGARMLVMHDNRVLQSLMLLVPGKQAKASGQIIRLEVENIVKADFSALRPQRPYDMSLVLNHGPNGEPRFATITPGFVEFCQPSKGFDLILAAASKQLTAINRVNSAGRRYKNVLRGRLYKLAHIGSKMRTEVCYGKPALKSWADEDMFSLTQPQRLQVVEAKPDAFLPVEIFYDYQVPNHDAALCTKFIDPTFPGGTCGECPDRGSPRVICPIGFWGVSRVIERQPWRKIELGPGMDYAIGPPEQTRRVLPKFTSAMCAFSSRVNVADRTNIAASLKKLTSFPCAKATGWQHWKNMMASDLPALVAVVAHTSMTDFMLSQMEVEGEQMISTELAEGSLRHLNGSGPVMLMLGCGTRYGPGTLGELTTMFTIAGAALTVATIADLRGKQAALCIKEIGAAFGMAPGAATESSENTVGWALLGAKQRLMGSGSAMALTLSAAGDAEWVFG